MSLLLAARHGDVAAVQRLIAGGADVNGPPSELSPLHLAAQYGHLPVVRALLAAGANPAAADRWQYCPLHLALNGGHEEIALLLLAAAPETAAVATGYARFPIHMAGYRGLTSATQRLLQLAPELAAHDTKRSMSPLWNTFFAAQTLPGPQNEGHIACARLMLPHVPPDHALHGLSVACAVALPFYADLAVHWPLTDAQWRASIPAPCPGLGRALPAVLARSQAEAALLVAHPPAADKARLRTAALSLHRCEQQLGVPLPREVAARILL